MEKYFAVFKIEWDNATGRDLAALLDYNRNDIRSYGKIIRGFETKSKMCAFVDHHKDGFREIAMLKPIS